MKRYAIVRVDNNCPFMQEKFDFSSCNKMFNCDKFIRCEKCEHNCRYGDTKEQFIMKVATAIFRREVKAYKKFWGIEPSRVVSADMYSQCLKVAEEIVEFLGVEE